MNILRRLPARQLLALCAAVVLIVAGGTAVAVAVTSNAPKPPPKRLAVAIHDALGAPAVKGVTATISFTNKLIDDSNIEGPSGSALLKSATGRLWATQNHLRLELQNSGTGGGPDSQLVVNGRSWWAYDSPSNTVYRGTLPAHNAKKHTGKEKGEHGIPTVAEITKKINEAARNASLSGAIPSTVAGKPAYTLRVGPKHDGGLLGAVELGWNAVNGVPLRAAVYAQGSNTPVLELSATDVNFGSVPASDFSVSPPSGAKVVRVSSPSGHHTAKAKAKSRSAKRRAEAAAKVRGVSAVAAAVPFKLSAPSKLAGLPRQDVKLLDWNGHRAALVTYGQNLGGIAVIERKPDASHPRRAQQSSSGDNRDRTRLPTLSINGATGTELATALGTVVQFDRGGVSYVVLGSVPPQAAEAAARGL
jgi:outer membrane lipoprotein-sorting protein